MSFIGSTVNIISPCDDGGTGEYPVEIDIYYYFKDKNSLYVYNTSGKKMKKLSSHNVKNVKMDDYDYLSQLTSSLVIK